MIALALRTGIPVREWRREDSRTRATAWDLLGVHNDGESDEDWPDEG